MSEKAADKDLTVIKGKIFTPKHNFYGIFVAFIDNYTSIIDSVSLVFSIYSETHDLSLDESWDKFEKRIQDMIYSGNFSKSITASTTDKLKGDTEISSFAAELRDNIHKNSVSLIDAQFKHSFSKALNDTAIELHCSFEGISTAQLQEGRLREDKSKSEEPASENLSPQADYRMVKAKLILAPVDGKLITELQEGDNILLSLIPVSMLENSIIDKLKLRKPDGSARPAPGKVVKIQGYGKGWQLLVHIMENYYAKIIEEEKILVKMSAKGASSSSPSAKKSSGHKSGISWIAVAVVILLGMVITYYAFLGG